MRIFSRCLVVGVLSAGCSMMKTAPNKLVVERRWVCGILLCKKYLGARRIHRFQPILLDKMVIVGNAIDGVVGYDRDTALYEMASRCGRRDEGGAFVADEDSLFWCE